ncbi:unnamed protein product [Calypogeia fissa]
MGPRRSGAGQQGGSVKAPAFPCGTRKAAQALTEPNPNEDPDKKRARRPCTAGLAGIVRWSNSPESDQRRADCHTTTCRYGAGQAGLEGQYGQRYVI